MLVLAGCVWLLPLATGARTSVRSNSRNIGHFADFQEACEFEHYCELESPRSTRVLPSQPWCGKMHPFSPDSLRRTEEDPTSFPLRPIASLRFNLLFPFRSGSLRRPA